MRHLVLLDFATVVVMLPVAGCVASGNRGGISIPILLVVDVSVCLCVGLLSMLVGFGLWQFSSGKTFGESMVRYGAGLGVIFGVTTMLVTAVRHLVPGAVSPG